MRGSLSLSLSQMSVPQISAAMQEIWKLAVKERVSSSHQLLEAGSNLCALCNFPPCAAIAKSWEMMESHKLLMGDCQRGFVSK